VAKALKISSTQRGRGPVRKKGKTMKENQLKGREKTKKKIEKNTKEKRLDDG